MSSPLAPVQRILLVCGIASSLVYVAMDILGALQWDGYSPKSQTVSELSAIGAPSRPLVVTLGLAYTLLVVVFGWGVRISAGRNRALRVVGGLLVAYGALGFVAPFVPTHLRGQEASLTDAMHIELTVVTILLMLIAIGFGAIAFGKRFRAYSIATIVILVVFGALAGLDGPRVAENLATPWIGITERINIGGFLLWVVVLAVVLLRGHDSRSRR